MPNLSITNLRALVARLQRQIDALASGTTASSESFTKIRTHCAELAARFERLCAEAGGTPRDLSKASRRPFAWIKLVGSDDHLERHVDALSLARRTCRRLGIGATISIHVHEALWSIKRSSGAVFAVYSLGFVPAREEIWETVLGQSLVRRTPARRETIARYVDGAEAAEYFAVLDEQLGPRSNDRAGRYHSLDVVFDRVNLRYFDGRMAKPILRWSERLTHHVFGSYRRAHDELMVSQTLDSPEVPDFVIDHVMHHELLHKQLGSVHVGHSRSVHGPEFRAAERRFDRLEEASAFIERLAREVRNAR